MRLINTCMRAVFFQEVDDGFMVDHRRKIKEQADFLSALQPVLLMGRGHSGTRVLSFACMHLGIQLGTSAATGDADDRTFTRTIKKIATRNLPPCTPDTVLEKDLIRFQNAVFRYYTTIGSPQTPWGWKFPETYLISAYVARTFPQARYIHMVRDGRDLAFKKHLTDDPKRKLGKKLLAYLDAMGSCPIICRPRCPGLFRWTSLMSFAKPCLRNRSLIYGLKICAGNRWPACRACVIF